MNAVVICFWVVMVITGVFGITHFISSGQIARREQEVSQANFQQYKELERLLTAIEIKRNAVHKCHKQMKAIEKIYDDRPFVSWLPEIKRKWMTLGERRQELKKENNKLVVEYNRKMKELGGAPFANAKYLPRGAHRTLPSHLEFHM